MFRALIGAILLVTLGDVVIAHGDHVALVYAQAQSFFAWLARSAAESTFSK